MFHNRDARKEREELSMPYKHERITANPGLLLDLVGQVVVIFGGTDVTGALPDVALIVLQQVRGPLQIPFKLEGVVFLFFTEEEAVLVVTWGKNGKSKSDSFALDYVPGRKHTKQSQYLTCESLVVPVEG
jgi:hypothetical protein